MAMKRVVAFELFCLAVKRERSPTDTEALRRAVATTPDWSCFTSGAQRHLLAPLLLAGLQACDPPCAPAWVIAELRREAAAAARRSLAQMIEIERLARAFAAADVKMLVLKGVALSMQLYGNPTLRGGRDIDILIDQRELLKADATLVGLGYRSPFAALSRRESESYQHWIKEVQYVHPVSGVCLELHHRPSDNPALLDWDFATLWSERAELCVGHALIATLPRKHLALYLCAHGAGHCWERLRWLLDLAELLREPGSVDAAIEAADAEGLGSAMLHALMLAHEWFDLTVDERHLARARADKPVLRLHRILAHLYAGPAWSEMPRRGSWRGALRYSVWARLYRLSIKSDWRYRGRQVMREWFTPADWSTLRLPDSLFWMYPFVRPLGWVLRRWQR
jgi:hypothetical protein